MTAAREVADVFSQAVSWGNVVVGIAAGAGAVLLVFGLMLIHLHRRR